MECSGPQPTGCPFRTAVSALVARHAHVGGDPLQDDVGATSNKLVAHDDYFCNDVFSGRPTVVFDDLQRRQRVRKKTDTAIGGWHRSLKKFNAIRMATNSAVNIDT